MPHVSADLLMEVVQRSVWRETAVASPANDWGETMENGLMMAGLIHGSHRGICHKKGPKQMAFLPKISGLTWCNKGVFMT
jgi:hypothetical protein